MANLKRVIICRATPVAPDPRVAKIARSLQEGNYAVSVLGWDMSGSYPREEWVNGVQIYRLRVTASFGRGIINLAHQLRWQVALGWWLINKRSNYDLIHACDFDTVLPALMMKIVWGKKVVYDIFDFYADMLRATPGLIKRLIRWVDLRVIRFVDAVILADDARKEQIKGSRPKRLVVINNVLDAGNTYIANKKMPPASLTLAYVGNLQIERGLLSLIEVLENNPDISLDLAGFGGDEQEIIQTAKELTNIQWHGRVEYERALEINRLADALIATYDPSIPNHRYASPNKVFEAMVLGKPIIVASHTNMDEIINKYRCGLVVEYGNTDSLNSALLELKNNPDLRKRLGENGRKAYETEFNWPKMQARLLSLYSSINI
ncbi:MAG: glycosyltransferase family 4 protein [Anaerolineales bacterium]|nr:glycosyltransferase family 4 protein [Anaerolineales bacterium]